MTGYFVLKNLVILNIVPKSVDSCQKGNQLTLIFELLNDRIRVCIKTGSYP